VGAPRASRLPASQLQARRPHIEESAAKAGDIRPAARYWISRI